MREYNASGECVVQIHGAGMGEIALGFLESRRAQRRIYEVQWADEIKSGASQDEIG